jgi:hypothetical protein
VKAAETHFNGAALVAQATENLIMRGGTVLAVAGNNLTVQGGGAATFVAGNDLHIQGGGGNVFIARGDVRIQAGGGNVFIARRALVRQGFIACLITGQARLGPGSRVLISPVAAAAFGAAAGLAWALAQGRVRRGR